MNNFGMNPMGMNPMFMNPMLMNNFGMMGMNNQQNLMDENAIRIKNIIQPYENKIKELEEIIRQKDFEIALLKDKLNNNGINIQSQNIININPMNQMNMMMENLNVKNIKKGKEITASLVNDTGELIEKHSCFENDMTYKLLDKINPNYHWNLLKFYCNGKRLHPFLTLKENGIQNNFQITSDLAINFNFENLNGYTVTVVSDVNYPIKKAIKYYLLRIGKERCFDKYVFLSNSEKLNIEDKKPSKEIFKNNTNVRIIAIEK